MNQTNDPLTVAERAIYCYLSDSCKQGRAIGVIDVERALNIIDRLAARVAKLEEVAEAALKRLRFETAMRNAPYDRQASKKHAEINREVDAALAALDEGKVP